MSNQHFHTCDECGHMEVSYKPEYISGMYYFAPKKWTTVSGYDVCSKKCAKAIAEKLSEVNDETVHCCCKGCK